MHAEPSRKRFIPKKAFQALALLGLLGVLAAWIGFGSGVRAAIGRAAGWLGEPALRLLPWLFSLLVFLVPWAALMFWLRGHADVPGLREELVGLDPAQRRALDDAAGEVDHALSRAGSERSLLNTVGAYVTAIVLTAPAMLLWSLWPALVPKLLEPAWLGLLVLGTAVGGSLWSLGRAPWWVGALAGAVAAPGAVFSVLWWIADRSEVFSVEVVLAICIGSAPGWLVFGLGARLTAKRRS